MKWFKELKTGQKILLIINVVLAVALFVLLFSGAGNMDFHRIIAAAVKAGVKYYCVEQDNCPVDFEETVKFSSDYLHKNFMQD